MPACGFCLSLQVFCMFLCDSVYLGASSAFHLLFLLDRATQTEICILLNVVPQVYHLLQQVFVLQRAVMSILTLKVIERWRVSG